MDETDMETVSRKKMKPASRYKQWLEGGEVGQGLEESILQGGGVPLSLITV